MRIWNPSHPYKTTYTLIWYAFYNLWPGNAVGPILTAPEPTWGRSSAVCVWVCLDVNQDATNHTDM